MKKIRSGIVLDSFVLTLVRVIVALIAIIISKLLAVNFTIEEFGGYSQAILITTTGTSLTILGLTDGTNYFFNKNEDENKRSIYMATIFGMQFIIGSIFAALVLVFSKQIALYFNNFELVSIIPFIAFIPLLNNIMNMLQVLFVSASRAKVLAIRNFILAIIRVFYIWIICLKFKSVKGILICLLIVEIGTVLYMWFYVKRYICHIRFSMFSSNRIKEILMYSIPMAGYIITNSLARSMDKLIIGRLGTSSDLAVYTIASKELPFDLLTAAFVTVLIPYITRFVGMNDKKSATFVFSKYIQISYLITWPIGFGALVASRDLISILYDEKYLVGIVIFAIYIFIDMIRFANVSLIFSAKGKTRELLLYSCVALCTNIILNILMYNIFGLLGPAIATIVIMVCINSIMLVRSSKLIGANIFFILNIKQMLILLVEICIVGIMVLIVRKNLTGMPLLIRFGISYILFVFPVFILNYKSILRNLKELNSIKITEIKQERNLG